MEHFIDSPYQPPKHYDLPIEASVPPKPYSAANSMAILMRWFVVCVLSAAPSFLLGLMLDGRAVLPLMGMLIGVLCFIIAYTALEHVPLVRRLLARKPVRRTAQIGYGTRIGISIIFPVGFYLDMFVGLGSTQVSWWILGFFGKNNAFGTSGDAGDFTGHFVMTIVHGAFLNMILFSYMLMVYLIVNSVMSRSQSARSKKSAI